MNKLIIEGVPPYDGTHEFEDFASFTNRELHRIKKMTGIRVGEFSEALGAGDNDLLVALATVILERNGITVNDDILWDADAGAITMDFTTEDAEDPTQGSLPLLESDSPTKIDVLQSPSGNGSSKPSTPSPEIAPSPTGDPSSETPTSGRVSGQNPSAS